jgi:uncharacterized membrane protein YfcA
MWTPETLVVVTATFLIAGFVKGVTGLGLPTVALALLTATLGLKEAMVLMLVPSFVTNVWQGAMGGSFVSIVRRFWTLLAAGCIGTWFAAGVLARADTTLLSVVLGTVLCVYSTISLTTPQVPPPGRWEWGLSPAVGVMSGVLTGLTGTFVIPAVLYFQAIGLPRNMLVQTMGVWFATATLALTVSLGGHNLLPAGLGTLSGVALVPAIIGMMLGQRIRRSMHEGQFRHVLFGTLLILGVYIVARAIFQ